MSFASSKKRKLDDSYIAKARKSRKQQYHSSSSLSSSYEEDEFPATNSANTRPNISPLRDPDEALKLMPNEEPSQDSESESSAESTSTFRSISQEEDTKRTNHKSKRNDPAIFASSISAILSSKLTTTKRPDPVLSRSSTAAEANTSLANSILEKKARTKSRIEKKAALEKGRVKDVLLGTEGEDQVAIIEEEKRLRKTAQKGVVKLFNAVRQAQVRGEEARKNSTAAGRTRREEQVGEMSKKGFLEMVAGGGTARADT